MVAQSKDTALGLLAALDNEISSLVAPGLNGHTHTQGSLAALRGAIESMPLAPAGTVGVALTPGSHQPIQVQVPDDSDG